MTLSLRQALAKLPPEWHIPLDGEIRGRLLDDQRTIVVLDDDPTGTQTVYDVPVLTQWSVGSLTEQLKLDDPLFYVLTNSRSLPKQRAIELAHEVGENLVAAAQAAGREIDLISRSDSTLRGHFPDEVNALASSAKLESAVQVIAPFFLEGGRFTIDDVHYVADGDTLTPAAQTPFAQDAVFGFTESNLKAWVVEKYSGQFPAEDIYSVSIEQLREKGPESIATWLAELPAGAICVVNAVSLRDMQVFALAMLIARESGTKFLCRTAASFVQARAGLVTKPLLLAESIVNASADAGLIVVGSYVPKTTEQLGHLVQGNFDDFDRVELSVSEILEAERREQIITQAASQIERGLANGRDVLLATSRQLVTRASEVENLEIGNIVSAALVEVVRRLDWPLRFLIAKGGITSSDLATRGLDVRRARVLGQILPGVPVWRLGEESRQPGLGYVVFPGNVGDHTALSAAYEKLRKQTKDPTN